MRSWSFLVPMRAASGTYVIMLACVCTCMCVWTCRGIATGDRNKSIPVHGCLNNGEQLVPGWERLLCRLD